jgi:hypothetical protein
LQADQFLRERSNSIDVTAAITNVYPYVADIDPTQARKRLSERRDADAKFFWGRGRDLEEFAVSVKQNDKGRWDVTGPRRDAQPSVEREEIVTALVKGGGPMTIKQIAA